MLYPLLAIPKMIETLLGRLTTTRAGYLDNIPNINTKSVTIDTALTDLKRDNNLRLSNLDIPITDIPTSYINTIIKEEVGGENTSILSDFSSEGSPPFSGSWWSNEITMGSSVTNMSKTFVLSNIYATAIDSNDLDWQTNRPLKTNFNADSTFKLPIKLTAVNKFKIYISDNSRTQVIGSSGLRQIVTPSSVTSGDWVYYGTAHIIELK